MQKLKLTKAKKKKKLYLFNFKNIYHDFTYPINNYYSWLYHI